MSLTHFGFFPLDFISMGNSFSYSTSGDLENIQPFPFPGLKRDRILFPNIETASATEI